MSRRRYGMEAMLGALVLCGPLGCASHSGPAAPPPALPVKVASPIRRSVVDYHDYTGRFAAPDSVQIRARVNGYLDRIEFEEGAEVKEGDVLYQIDPRPYQAILDQAQAQVKLQQANLKYQESVYQRDVKLVSSGAVTTEDVQSALAQRDTAQASLNAAKASVEQARLNLEFTQVKSPIAGLISRTLVTRGNLIVADQTLLTTVVSQDPIYVYFDVDEQTVLTVRELIREGKVVSAREKGSRYPVYVGLPTESGFPHEGYIGFLNNQIDPASGTLQIRGIFANPKPEHGPRLFTAGLFVRVRVPVSARYDALLVTVDAIGSDQNVRYVYVVNDQNQVERRNVKLGTQHGGLQAIVEGVTANDRIVVSNVQRVHPGMTVTPTETAMPEDAGATNPTTATRPR